jgi:hypothetical protein
MNLKAFAIATLLSSLMWVGSFQFARHAYRDAETLGVMPNLHIMATLHDALADDDAL